MPFLHVDSLHIRLGKFSLDNISLSCGKGDYHILLGPSGSGKSTLVKCILGFHKMSSGTIVLDGKNITRELPENRRMGYVPQNYALFPHLNVEQNIAFGLKARGILAHEREAIVNRLVGILKIEKLLKRRVQNLSGGEKQKVALGRALGAKPEVILLDEPFSSIDEGGKRGLWFELKQIVEEVGITTIHITHNLEEAYTLGQHLSVLIGGNLVQHGPKQDIFERPRNENIAKYLGYTNIFKGIAEEGAPGTRIGLNGFDVAVKDTVPIGKEVTLCIRQQDIKIVRENTPLKDSLKRNVFSGTIVDLFPLPEFCLMWFKLDGSEKSYDMELKFPLHIRDRHNLYPGKKVQVALWEPTIILFEQ
jgi:ABC-type Fe3+/spermidine/putrescine transport system ATPase subunit